MALRQIAISAKCVPIVETFISGGISLKVSDLPFALTTMHNYYAFKPT